jgi:glycine oxidase
MPDVCQVRNNRLCRALAIALRRRRVRFLEGVECLDIAGGSILTSRGKIAAGRTVVATGAWARELTGRLGAAVPVRPIRGQMLLAQGAPGFLRRIIVSKDQYMIPRRDGRIVIGSTVEDVGFDKSVTMAGAGFLARRAFEMVPGARDLPLLASWAGLRPGCPDRVPLIGPHPMDERVLIATGHYRNGILLAPATGRLIHAMITGARPPIDPSPYSLSGRTIPAGGCEARELHS